MADCYTKAVLTIIAGALIVLSCENVKLLNPAHAQSSGPIHVVVDSVASYAFQYAGPLAVHEER